MKAFTVLQILAVLIMMNPVFAQQEHHLQELIQINPNALQESIGFNLPGSIIPTVHDSFKSDFNVVNDAIQSVKLDSVVTTESKNTFWSNPKMLYEYNSYSQLVQITRKEWNAKYKTYGITGKIMFYYNPDELLDSVNFNVNYLVDKYSHKYIYDENDRLKTFLLYKRAKPKWIPEEKKEYSYNHLNQLVQIVHWGRSINGDTTTFIYDDTGKLSECNSSRGYKLTYSDDGKLLQERVYASDGFLIFSLTYTWNPEGNLVQKTFDEFVYGVSDTTKFFYSSAGELYENSKGLKLTFSEWDFHALNVPIVLSYNLYSLPDRDLVQMPPVWDAYDSDYTGALETTPQKLIKELNYTDVNGESIRKISYYYSPVQAILAGNFSMEAETITVFPNPADEYITISWGGKYNRLNLKIYHAAGVYVMDRDISSGTQISLSHLPKGMYLYKLVNENQPVSSGKLIVK